MNMQTRKRNIDAVLNLVNPKRLKLQKSSPKKESDSIKKAGTCSNKGKQTKLQKPANEKKKNDVKQYKSATKNEKISQKVNKHKHNSVERKSVETKKIVQATCAAKPFKKRPLVNIHAKETSNSLNENEAESRQTKKEISAGEKEVENEICSQTGMSEPSVRDDKVDKAKTNHTADEASTHKTTSKKLSNETTFTCGEIEDTDGNNAIENADSNIQTRILKTTQRTKKESKENIDVVDSDSSDDDGLIDSGAIEDDRDTDFVVSKKELEECSLEYDASKDNNKTTQVELIDIKKIKLEEGDQDEKKPVYSCDICGIKLSTKFRLKKHMGVHGAKTYKCDICGLKFKLNYHLKRHMDIHLDDSKKPFSCKKCSKSFSRKSSLDVHQITHQDEKPFTCPICFKLFKRKISFNNHYKVHQHGRMYICQYCGKSFGFRASLTSHLVKHAGPEPYVCTVCGKGYYSKQSFTDHNLRHQKLKEVTCSICNRKYYNKKELKKHMGFHITVTDFQCVPCKMYFKDEHCMRVHRVKVHSTIYPCEFCDSKFTNLRLFKTHVFREHRELRNARRPKMPIHEKANFKHVLCDFCGKELSNKYRLHKHLVAKHSGMKRERKPRDPHEVREPVKVYPSGQKVLCTICNKVMFNKYKLYKHMEKMHDIPREEILKVELVRLEEETEIENTESIPNEVDVQTIVIKPIESSEIGTVQDGSTVHYLDAHGNVIYTDTNLNKMYEYVNKIGNDSSHETVQNIIISQANSDKIPPNIITKAGGNISFPKNIVDFAVQAAKIIDVDEGIVTNETVVDQNIMDAHGQQMIIPSQNGCNLTSNTNDNQDITYIVQQATNRIAAHENAQSSRSLLNQSDESSNQHGVKVNVNDVQNIDAESQGSIGQDVKYIIEETGESVDLSEYVVKEGSHEIAGEFVLAGNPGSEQQKIIIIDEQGGEQVISAGNSDQIKISFDPETGLYSYIAEEVVVQQEDGPVHQIPDNANYDWVILSENDPTIQTPIQHHELIGQNQKSSIQGEGLDTHNKLPVEQHIESIGLDGKIVRHVIDKTTHVTQESPLASNIEEIQTVILSKQENTQLSTSSSKETEGLQSPHLDTADNMNDMPLLVIKEECPSNRIQDEAGTFASTSKSGEVVNSVLTGINDSIQLQASDMLEAVSDSMTKQSVIMPADTNTCYTYSSPQQSQLFISSLEPSSILSCQSSVPSSLTVFPTETAIFSAASTDYPEHQRHTDVHISDTQLDSNTVVHIPMNETSSQMLEDISQSVLSLEQSTDPQKSDYSNLAYNKSILNLDSGVTIAAADQGELNEATHVENVTYIVDTASVGGEMETVMSEGAVIEIDETSDRRDLIQLENMLKSGISDVSNTSEYTNFLDRMINHLQSAKADVSGKEVPKDNISESQ